MKNLTQHYLRECFDYDSETGECRWRIRPKSHFKNEASLKKSLARRPEGSLVGSSQRLGRGRTEYQVVNLDGSMRLVHRLIYIWKEGSIPEGLVIDHIDGDGLNNRWSNIRLVDHCGNAINCRLQERNIHGRAGIRQTKAGRWRARIGMSGGEFSLGTFDTKPEAIAARVAAERLLGFSERHGKEGRL